MSFKLIAIFFDKIFGFDGLCWEIAFKITSVEGGSAGAQIPLFIYCYKQATPMESTILLALAL
jgi:hypothetical protein